MAKNQGKFDGLSVELYDGKFSGVFEMDAEMGTSVSYDDVVCFMVVTTVGRATIDSTKSGDMKRTNSFDVEEVRFIPNEMAAKVANLIDTEIDGVNHGQLTFDHNADEHFTQEELDQPTELVTISSAPKVAVEVALDSFLNETLEDEDF